MNGQSWGRVGSTSALIHGSAYLAGAILSALTQFQVFVQEPDYPSNATPFERDVLFFGFLRETWKFDLPTNLLFAAGFVLLIPIGLALGQALRERPAAGSLASAFLLFAGIVGAAAQLLDIGSNRAILQSSRFMNADCCREVLTGLGPMHAAWGEAANFLRNGVFIGGGIGILVAALAARATRPASRAWATFSMVLAAVYFLGFAGYMLDVNVIIDFTPIIGAGILAPIWAFWLAREFPRLSSPPETPA
jgi:hypothetical protein